MRWDAEALIPEFAQVGAQGVVKLDRHVDARGIPPREVFLEAKDWSAGIAYGGGPRWSQRIDDAIDQSERQLAAIPEGALPEWHISNPHAAAAMRRIFAREGLDVVEVYTPAR